MKRLSAIAIGIVFSMMISLFFLPITVKANTDVTFDVTYCQSEARDYLPLINSFRADTTQNWQYDTSNNVVYPGYALSSFSYDYNLEKIAMQRAAEAIMSINVDHIRPNGEAYYTCTYNGTRSACENCMACGGNISAAESLEMFKESGEPYAYQGHRRALLGNYSAVGIAKILYRGLTIYVIEFGNFNSGAPATPANDSLTTVSVNVNPNNTPVSPNTYSSSIGVGVNRTASLSFSFKLGSVDCSSLATITSISVDDPSIASYDATNNTIRGLSIGSTVVRGYASYAGFTIPVTANIYVGEICTFTPVDCVVVDNNGQPISSEGPIEVLRNTSVRVVPIDQIGRTFNGFYSSQDDYLHMFNQNSDYCSFYVTTDMTVTGSYTTNFQTCPDITISFSDPSVYSGVYYDGSAIRPSITIKDKGAIVSSYQYYVTYDNNTNAGPATATITTRSNAYTGTRVLNYTILPLPLSLCTVTAADVIDYGNTIQTAVTVTTPSGRQLRENTDYTVSYQIDNATGTGTVVINSLGNNTTGTNSAVFSITEPQRVDQGEPSIYSFSYIHYDGQPHSLGYVVPGAGGTNSIYYRAYPAGDNHPTTDHDYQTSEPTAVNAGDYIVYFRIAGDATHNDYESSFNAHIIGESQGRPTINNTPLVYTGSPIPLGSVTPGVYGENVTYSLSENGVFTENPPTATEVRTRYIVYYRISPSDGNHEEYSGYYFVDIVKGDQGVPTVCDAEDHVYSPNGVSLGSVEPGLGGAYVLYSCELFYEGESVIHQPDSYGTSLPSGLAPGTYIVYYKVVGDSNHNDYESYYFTSVSKTNQSEPEIANASLTYNGTPQCLGYVVPGTGGCRSVYYSLAENGAYSINPPVGTEVGVYTVYFRIEAADQSCCNDYEGSYQISITPSQSLTPDIVEPPVAEGTVNMYRLYNPNSGEHFYTSNVGERNMLISVGWTYEGVGWVAPTLSNTPVFRLYNANGGEHHYTSSVDERDFLVSVGWSDEGIGWYSDDEQTVPLYRQYNPNAYANNHNYTTSLEENDWLVSIGWHAEGIGWYGIGVN